MIGKLTFITDYDPETGNMHTQIDAREAIDVSLLSSFLVILDILSRKDLEPNITSKINELKSLIHNKYGANCVKKSDNEINEAVNLMNKKIKR